MITLTGDKVAMIPIFDPDKVGSIYIPDQAKERVDQGIIKYLGPDVPPEEYKIGDYCLFSAYSGTMIQLEDEGLLIIMPAEFLTCKLEPPDTEVPGLYFRSPDNEVFTATYEQAMNLIAEAFINEGWRSGFTAVGRTQEMPTPVDHEKWR